ncbi:MAG: winged helix-turn-helix domain-containing protein [Acidobacteria bacterium]|nr:winged helix-turn-helix domain-containing protein [Acidobacteriota bacterium]MBV9476188.1 winged helix-turn-helix domain-containing protein [Acidobacteriota bacterium]
MSDGHDPLLRFGDFTLDRRTLELRRGGVAVKLQQQPARVLVLLVERAGELVERETLRKAIWDDDTFVDFDRGLNYCIRQIRAALGDTAEAPVYLETLRGRGYRFVAQPAAVDAQPERAARNARPRWIAIAAATAAVLTLAFFIVRAKRSGGVEVRNAIGVAAFATPASERAWSDALRAQILSRLASASRTPVIDLAGPVDGAPPRWQIDARVDRSAEQYRVTLMMRDARDHSIQWSDVFAGAPGEWIDAQSAMADRMTEAIRYHLEGPSAGLPKRRAFLPPSRGMTLHH